MNIGIAGAATIVIYFSINVYSSTCLSCSFLIFLNTFIITLGFCCVLWIHILLSSPHKAGVGIEYVQKELEQFRSKLMVTLNDVYIVIDYQLY